MKKFGVVLVAIVLLLGIGVAVAVGGSSTDPLISKSYLEDTYIPALKKQLRERASAGTKTLYEGVVARLDALGGEDVSQAESSAQEGSAAYTPAGLDRGDSVSLQTGGSLVLYSGGCRLSEGTLADVTAGTTLAAGESLTAGHRYIVTSAEAAKIVSTDPGDLGYQGIGSVAKGETAPLPFQDVREGSWYYGAVEFVYGKGYFSGTAADRFSPNDSMTRAMLATVLHRVAGRETPGQSEGFTDVPAGQWYSDGIAWASAKGVVNGMGNGLYHPNDPVTRQQMVTMLYRFATVYAQMDVARTGDLAAFPDGGQVADWARDAMAWAVGAGVIQGRDTGHLDPSGTASRAEVATVLERFTKLLPKG